MEIYVFKDHSGAAVEDQRGQEWKQMGSYLSLPVFWSSSGPYLAFLKGMRLGTSVSEVAEPRLFC